MITYSSGFLYEISFSAVSDPLPPLVGVVPDDFSSTIAFFAGLDANNCIVLATDATIASCTSIILC